MRLRFIASVILLILPLALLATWPVDVWLDERHNTVLTIDQRGEAVAITFSVEDFDTLRNPAFAQLAGVSSCELADFSDAPWTWRCAHARLLDKMVDAGAKVVAFDFHFPSWGESPEQQHASQAFATAIERAKEKGVHVVIGQDGSPPDHKLYELAHAGVMIGQPAPFTGKLRDLLLFEDIGGKPVPSIVLQAWSLAQSGRPAEITSTGQIEWPTRLAAQERLWLRFPEDAPLTVSYRDALRMDQVEVFRGKAVFVGLGDRWAAASGDMHPFPYLPPGLPQTQGKRGYAPGVYAHLFAYNQLSANAEALGAGPRLLPVLLLLAALVVLSPFLFLLLSRPRTIDLFTTARPLGLAARLRPWPWPPLLGLCALLVLQAATWWVPFHYPPAYVALAGLVAAVWLTILGWPARHRARRLVRAMLRADEAWRRAGHPERVLRLPPGGIQNLEAILSLPTLDEASLHRLVNVLHGALVEAGEGKTFVQHIPTAFFHHHGHLTSECSWPKGRCSRAGPGRCDGFPVWGDCIAETSVVTRIRRIRNLWAHSELPPHAFKLGHDAVAWLWGAGSHNGLGAQLRLMEAVIRYVEDLARWPDRREGTSL